MGLFSSNLSLAPEHVFFAILLAAQGVFYGLALSGALFQAHERFARVAFTFVTMNIAVIAGLAALRRRREVWR